MLKRGLSAAISVALASFLVLGLDDGAIAAMVLGCLVCAQWLKLRAGRFQPMQSIARSMAMCSAGSRSSPCSRWSR